MTFTPNAGGHVIITGTYQAQKSGSDWGSGAITQCYLLQADTETYAGDQPLSNVRSHQTIRWVFDVVPGVPIECGLFGKVTGATSASWWDIAFTVEHVKR